MAKKTKKAVRTKVKMSGPSAKQMKSYKKASPAGKRLMARRAMAGGSPDDV